MNLAIAVEKCQPHCRYDTLSYYPRSVHPHFQGLCVVFGLLISIPSARLTEQCCSHLLWLCESAESDLITSVCKREALQGDFSPLQVPFLPFKVGVVVIEVQFVVLPSYTYIISQLCGFVKGYLQSFSKNFQSFNLLGLTASSFLMHLAYYASWTYCSSP